MILGHIKQPPPSPTWVSSGGFGGYHRLFQSLSTAPGMPEREASPPPSSLTSYPSKPIWGSPMAANWDEWCCDTPALGQGHFRGACKQQLHIWGRDPTVLKQNRYLGSNKGGEGQIFHCACKCRGCNEEGRGNLPSLPQWGRGLSHCWQCGRLRLPMQLTLPNYVINIKRTCNAWREEALEAEKTGPAIFSSGLQDGTAPSMCPNEAIAMLMYPLHLLMGGPSSSSLLTMASTIMARVANPVLLTQPSWQDHHHHVHPPLRQNATSAPEHETGGDCPWEPGHAQRHQEEDPCFWRNYLKLILRPFFKDSLSWFKMH